MSYAWLGPVAELRQVPCPQSGVSVGVERRQSEMTLLDGSRFVQVSRRRHKSWDWSYVWDDPAMLAWLSELASGAVVGPVYLYTSKAARENLAPPQLQVGGSGVVSGRRVLAAGDPEVRSYQVPVLPGRAYSLSALGDGAGSVSASVNDPAPLTNLATNPSFETSGSMVEVMRNHAVDPAGVSNVGNTVGPVMSVWAGSGGAVSTTVYAELPWTPFGRGKRYVWTTAPSTGSGALQIQGLNSLSVGVWTITIRVRTNASTLGLPAFGDAPGAVTVDRFVTQEGDIFTLVHTLEITTPFTSNNARISAGLPNVFVGAFAEISELDIYPGPYQPERKPFTGSYSPDPDLTPSWTDASNASASVLHGASVAGMGDGGGNTGRHVVTSTMHGVVSGEKSLRIFRTGTSHQTAAGAVFRTWTTSEVGKTFTVAAWCTIPDGYDDTDDSVWADRASRGLYLVGNLAGSVIAPSTPGTHLVRAVVMPQTTTQTVRLGGGGAIGQSVYWDDMTIMAGAHPDLMPISGGSTASTTVTPSAGERAGGTILTGQATTLTITPTAGVGQIRVTEGSHAGFMTGDGIVPVMIQDPAETLQRVLDGDHRSDFTVTIKEIG